MHVIPFPSERVFNSATFMCSYIVLSHARNFSNLHFYFFYYFIFHHSKNTVCMPVIPFPSERVFNSATFTCRYIALSTARNVSNLHLKFPFFFLNFPSHSKTTLCMPVIPFPSERVFNSATVMCRHIVLATVRFFLNLHLKNCSG